MAFLDNSGNIILDCVLTDTGRMRLAKGQFSVKKIAFGDDEISYGNFNINHPSGSAYFDLSILQSPILEAFTNNTSTMNSKLISISRTNLLYLPIIQINNINSPSNKMHSIGSFVVAVDKATETSYANTNGVLMGESLNGGTIIRCDQGLDTTEISPASVIDPDLAETQYIVELDNRFAKLVSTSNVLSKISYIDDDNIASYYLSLGTDPGFVTENTERVDISSGQVIQGPRGTILNFKLQSSLELNTSDYLFGQIGSTIAADLISAGTAVLFIDSYIRVTGATTGYRLDIPVRYIKMA